MKQRQEVIVPNYVRQLEKFNSNWIFMISEFIDNAIANHKKLKIKNDIRIEIEFNVDKKNKENSYFIFRDYCGGMNSYPCNNDEGLPDERPILKKEHIKNCFNFYQTSEREGLNKYGVGMKAAIYWIGRSWEVSTYVKNLDLFCKTSWSKENLNTRDKEIELNQQWSDKVNLDYKTHGTKIKVYDFSNRQANRFLKNHWFLDEYNKKENPDKKTYIIFLIAEKYKFYFKKNLKIKFITKLNNEITNKKVLDKTNIRRFVFQYEDFREGYSRFVNNWKHHLEEFMFKNDQKILKNKNNHIIGYSNTKENPNDQVKESVFYDLLMKQKQLKKTFWMKHDNKDIKIILGLLSNQHGRIKGFTKKNKFFSLDETSGVSFFVNEVSILIRSYNHVSLKKTQTRGGRRNRLVAEIFLEDGYIQPDPNKQTFEREKILFLKERVESLINQTGLESISQTLLNMNQNPDKLIIQTKHSKKTKAMTDELNKKFNNYDVSFDKNREYWIWKNKDSGEIIKFKQIDSSEEIFLKEIKEGVININIKNKLESYLGISKKEDIKSVSSFVAALMIKIGEDLREFVKDDYKKKLSKILIRIINRVLSNSDKEG